MTDAVKALRALYDACHWVPSEQYVLTMDEQIALWDQAKEALAANEESADWYGLGVKDGRDGCLVELDALQARCDELEAAAKTMLAHLVAAVSVIERSEESGNHPSCAYGSDTMYQMAMKDFHRCMEAGRKALRSVVDGGE